MRVLGNRDTEQMGEKGREKGGKRAEKFCKVKKEEKRGQKGNEFKDSPRETWYLLSRVTSCRNFVRFVNLMEISMERCLRFRFEGMSIDENGKNETSSPYRRTEHPVLTMNVDFGER